MRWKIVLQIWPHSTGKGNAADRQAVGGGDDRYFYTDADNIDVAMRYARALVEGIRTNPLVWEVPILGVYAQR